MSAERSQSRGREFTSSGRGGLGNIHGNADLGRPEDGPDDFSPTRGREPAVQPDKVMSTGRGGAGNIRSPSHGHHEPVGPDAREQGIVRDEAEKVEVFSTGRGGFGNMSRSRSRARGPVEDDSSAAIRSRSASQDPEHKKEKHGVAGLLQKVVHPLSHHHEHHEHHENGSSAPRDPNAPAVAKYPIDGAPLDGSGMGLQSAPGITRSGVL